VAGRPKGAKNKTSAEMRQQLVEAYLKRGGAKAWGELAQQDLPEFMRHVARLIPSESHVRSDSTVAIADVPLEDAKRFLAQRAAQALRPELVVDNTREDSERPSGTDG
jgi:hypothetical protein